MGRPGQQRLPNRNEEDLTPCRSPGLALCERTEQLGCFDAVVAAVTLADEPRSLVSADNAFADVASLPFVNLSDAAALGLLLTGQSPGSSAQRNVALDLPQEAAAIRR